MAPSVTRSKLPAHRADEGDAHHARLEILGGRVLLGDLESVDDEQLDGLVADGLARLLGQLLPDRDRIEVRLQDEGAALAKPAQWVRVAEHPVVGRDDELDVFEFGVGDQHLLGAEGDVVVGRRAALFRAVFRRGPRVQVERAGENVGEELAGGDRPVAADRMEADAEGRLRQELRIGLGLERHQLGVGIGGLELRLQFGQFRRRVLREELRAEIDERRVARLHVLERGDQVARLEVVRAEAEDRRGDLGRIVERLNAGVPDAVDVLARLEQGLAHHRGEGGDVRALEHRDRLLAGERGHDLGLRERLQQLDRDDADLLALGAQMLRDRADVVGDRAQPDHHVVGVVAIVGQDRRVPAPGERAVFRHRLAGDVGNLADEMGAVVDAAGLEVGLVLHPAGQARIVDVDERRDELARALLVSVQPLPPPLGAQFLGDESERLADQGAGGVGLDGVFVGGEEIAKLAQVFRRETVADANQILAELEGAAFGPEQHGLRHGRALDPARRIAEELAQEFGLGHPRFGKHVAGGEAVHRVGDRDQRQGADAIGDRREVGRFLRIAAEEDGVAGRQQRVDVVVAGHDVEGVLGDDARGDMQDEAADLLADGHVVRFHPVQDALTGGGVGDVLAAGQRRAERAALRRVLPFGLEEERVPAPDVESAVGAERLVDFRDFRRGGDGIADHAAAHAAHDLCYGAIAVNDVLYAGIFCGHVFPEDPLAASSLTAELWSLWTRGADVLRGVGFTAELSRRPISRARVRTPEFLLLQIVVLCTGCINSADARLWSMRKLSRGASSANRCSFVLLFCPASRRPCNRHRPSIRRVGNPYRHCREPS